MMDGVMCAAYGCSNRHRKGSDLHFYRFPNPRKHPENKERSKRWVVSIRRQDLLTKSAEYLHENCRLCSDHFSKESFMNPERQRDGLVWNAVPNKVLQQPGSKRKPPKDRTPSSQVEDARISPPPVRNAVMNDHTYSGGAKSVAEPVSQVNMDSVECMVDTIINLQKKVTDYTEEKKVTPEADKKELTIDEIVAGAAAFGLKPSATQFFRGQLENCNRSMKGHRWTDAFKGMSLGIYYRSRPAYHLLSSVFTLPSESTLHRFVRSIPSDVGISEQLLELIRLKTRGLNPEAKFCVVTFDEMAIREELNYSAAKDSISGMVQLQQKKPDVANQALVFMAKGLYSSWKQPVSFYFSRNAAGAADLGVLLKRNISGLMSAGLTPVAVVCDQGSCNRSLYTKLGISPDRPYFEHENQRIYALHDMPHVLKNIRNGLKKSGISLGENKYLYI